MIHGIQMQRCVGGQRMVAAAVVLLATFAFPLARGAEDDTMQVSWSPQKAECQQDVTGLKDYLNSDYYYQGETVDGRGYYAHSADSALLNGKQYEMYLYYDSATSWVFDINKPSVTEEFVARTYTIAYDARFQTNRKRTPVGLDLWYLHCNRLDFESDDFDQTGFLSKETLTITAVPTNAGYTDDDDDGDDDDDDGDDDVYGAEPTTTTALTTITTIASTVLSTKATTTTTTKQKDSPDDDSYDDGWNNFFDDDDNDTANDDARATSTTTSTEPTKTTAPTPATTTNTSIAAAKNTTTATSTSTASALNVSLTTGGATTVEGGLVSTTSTSDETTRDTTPTAHNQQITNAPATTLALPFTATPHSLRTTTTATAATSSSTTAIAAATTTVISRSDIQSYDAEKVQLERAQNNTAASTPLDNSTNVLPLQNKISDGAVAIIVILSLVAFVAALLLWRTKKNNTGSITLEAAVLAGAGTAAGAGGQSSTRIVNQVYGGIGVAVRNSNSNSNSQSQPAAAVYAPPTPAHQKSTASPQAYGIVYVSNGNNEYDQWGVGPTPVYSYSSKSTGGSRRPATGYYSMAKEGGYGGNTANPLPSHDGYSGYNVAASKAPIVYAIPMEDANVMYAIPVDTGSVHYDLAAAGNDTNNYDMSAPGERSAARRNKAVAVTTLGASAASSTGIADDNNSYDMSAPGERSAARRNKAVAVTTLGASAASSTGIAADNNSYDMSAPGERSAARSKGAAQSKVLVPERTVTKRRRYVNLPDGELNAAGAAGASNAALPPAETAF